MSHSSTVRAGGLVGLVLLVGCAPTSADGWRAERVAVTSGFAVPECALPAPGGTRVYVSNIVSEPGGYWDDDGTGHISILGADHQLAAEPWVKSQPGQPLHAPKGMCLLGEYLYVADNSRLLRYGIDGGPSEVVASGFQRANDLCTDGRTVWVADTAAGKVYSVTPAGEKREIPAPDGVNGLTFFGPKMFGVSWSLHEVYELDPTGTADPVPFGLASHFTNLDGIEVLDDGTFVVSDFTGNKVCTISADRARVSTLLDVPSPADIGLNRADGLLYVPLFMSNTLSVYRMRTSR